MRLTGIDNEDPQTWYGFHSSALFYRRDPKHECVRAWGQGRPASLL